MMFCKNVNFLFFVGFVIIENWSCENVLRYFFLLFVVLIWLLFCLLVVWNNGKIEFSFFGDMFL